MKPSKDALKRPVKVLPVKVRETRANFHVRWDEALFLGIVDITVIPWAHELWHVIAHVAVAVVK